MASGFRTTTRHRITKTGSEPLPFTPAEIAAAEKRERTLTQRMQRWQSAVDSFRSVKEVAKARITAAESARRVEFVLLESASAAGGDPADIEQAKADLAAAEASLPAAEAQAVAALAEARRMLLAIRREVRAAEASGDGASEDDDGRRADDQPGGTAVHGAAPDSAAQTVPPQTVPRPATRIGPSLRDCWSCAPIRSVPTSGSSARCSRQAR